VHHMHVRTGACRPELQTTQLGRRPDPRADYASEVAWCEALGKELRDRDRSGDCLFVSILESVANFVDLPPVVALLRKAVVAQLERAPEAAKYHNRGDPYHGASSSTGSADFGVAVFARAGEHGDHRCLMAACDLFGCCAVVWELGELCQVVFRRRGTPLPRPARHVFCGAVVLLSPMRPAPHAALPVVLWLRCHRVGPVVALC
jgi:hypothetical protein